MLHLLEVIAQTPTVKYNVNLLHLLEVTAQTPIVKYNVNLLHLLEVIAKTPTLKYNVKLAAFVRDKTTNSYSKTARLQIDAYSVYR